MKLEDRLHVQRLAASMVQLGLPRGSPTTSHPARRPPCLNRSGSRLSTTSLADSVGKPAPEQRIRHLALRENPGILACFLKLPITGPVGLGDLVGGNVQHQFLGALRIEDRAMLVVVVMIVASWPCSCPGSRSPPRPLRAETHFDFIGRTQRFCLPCASCAEPAARLGPNPCFCPT